MNNKITKPKKSLVENDEYFYRHPEMMRPTIEKEIQVKEKEERSEEK